MPRLALTDLSIRALKFIGERRDYWDTKTPSFGVRVGKNRKTFVAKVDNQRITIGEYPHWTLAKARDQAFGFKSTKADRAKQSSITVQAAFDQFEIVHIPTLKARTQKEMKRVLNRHLLPSLRHKKLAHVTHHDITSITDPLVGTPSEAWHAFKDIRTFFKWCVPRYIPHSPVEGLKSPTKYIARKRVLTDKESRAVWLAAAEIGYPFGTALQLCILWGCRWGEVISCRRAFADATKRAITLPVTKNKAEHHFPFGDMTAEILESIPRFNSTDLLFPGRDMETPWNGAGKAKWEFDQGCKIAHWQILDLRRTFGTKLAELGVLPHIVERLLNHKLGSISNRSEGVVTAIAEVYNRATYLPEMRDAVRTWEAHITSLLTSAKRSLPARAA
jgi:integrase